MSTLVHKPFFFPPFALISKSFSFALYLPLCLSFFLLSNFSRPSSLLTPFFPFFHSTTNTPPPLKRRESLASVGASIVLHTL